MHRRPLTELLQLYLAVHPGEADTVRRFLAFVDRHEDCLHRRCRTGHVTASAWIVSPDGSQCLLTLHRKLGRWLQLGGHVDGEPHVWRAALREAQEESGMQQFTMRTDLPLDVDIHEIPAYGGEPAHDHLDVRFLLRAARGQKLVRSAESLDLRWFHFDRLPAVNAEESVLRMARKAAALFWRGDPADNAP